MQLVAVHAAADELQRGDREEVRAVVQGQSLGFRKAQLRLVDQRRAARAAGFDAFGLARGDAVQADVDRTEQPFGGVAIATTRALDRFGDCGHAQAPAQAVRKLTQWTGGGDCRAARKRSARDIGVYGVCCSNPLPNRSSGNVRLILP